MTGPSAGDLPWRIGHTGHVQAHASSQLFVVVALIEHLEVGSSFRRANWPAHVTLASNFLVNAPQDQIGIAIAEACADDGPLPVRFGDSALFGRDQNIDVQIVESTEILALHHRLADLLEAMAGFATAEPSYWRDGYRPHMTHVPSLALRQGDAIQLPFIAAANLTQGDATITSALALQRRPAA
jgi:hypothetical protein